jgi:hypothetical protein
MNNELIENRSWWSTNWKWFLPTSIILFIIGICLLITAATDGNVADFAQAYTDNSLYEKALEKVKLNQRAKNILGEIEPIDKLAIIEGNTKYSNGNNSVETTVRIKGNKAKGKMDIYADRNGTEWEYKKINIRIKEPKEEIDILK